MYPAQPTVITNVTVVAPDQSFIGTVVFDHDGIREVAEEVVATPGAIDGEGDILAPGLIEMHTDNVERHIEPRPGVMWPSYASALLAHDTQMAGAGITTVYDAISVGDYEQQGRRTAMLERVIDALRQGVARALFRCEHALHLRCEVSDPAVLEIFEPLADDPLVRLVSVMDHTPGQRQWRDLEQMRTFHSKRRSYTDEELASYVRERQLLQARYAGPQREAVISRWRPRGLPLASHDDTTPEHVDEAHAQGIAIAEFPTTMAAAERAHGVGMFNVMGAPNLVRGGSHSGNVSAGALADRGLLHSLSSDYMPISLLHGALKLHDDHGHSLPEAIATVTANVATMIGLPDRGVIAPGKRADLVRFRRLDDGSAMVRTVWREGERIC